jgi:hypothetical protein
MIIKKNSDPKILLKGKYCSKLNYDNKIKLIKYMRCFMKKMFLLFLLLICVININYAAPFQNNTIVVVRVGNGSGVLTTAATAVFLAEYTTAGVLVQTIPLPTTVSGANKRLLLGGSNITEGSLTLSTDMNYLVLGGYDAALGTLNISGTTSASNNRVVARVAQNGTIDLTTSLTDAYSGGNINGVISTDGSKFWTSGSNEGVKYTTLGGTTSTQLSGSPINTRCINIFNSQLYISSQVAGFFGVSSVGTGLPTTSGQTISELTGFPATAIISPYAFQMNAAGNVIYVACDGNVNFGIQKWTLNGGTWSLAYIITPTLSFTGIVVDWTGTNPVIYATSLASSIFGGGAIYKGTDTGPGSSFTALVTTAANTVFRGISFTPGTVLPVELSSFTSNTNGRNVSLHWETKTEKNSDKFIVEREAIGANWLAISSVKAAVLSNSPKQYSFTDMNLQSGNYQYRLKMIDNDGSFEYSKIVETEVTLPKDFAVSQNYPNPFNPLTRIDYQIPVDSKVLMEVYNIAGQKVSELVNQEQSAGYYSVDFGASKLSSGVYIYRIIASDKVTGNNFSSIKKMMLLK